MGGNIAVRITEPRTRRGALAALSTLGETYREGAATPAPLEQAVVWGKMQRTVLPVLRLYCLTKVLESCRLSMVSVCAMDRDVL